MNSSISFTSESSRQIDGESDDDFYGRSEYSSSNGTMNGDNFNGSSSVDETMFNVYACQWPEFQAYMIKNFGEYRFQDGYDIIQDNYQDAMNEDDSEAIFADKCRHLDFEDEETLSTFVTNCCSYKMV